MQCALPTSARQLRTCSTITFVGHPGSKPRTQRAPAVHAAQTERRTNRRRRTDGQGSAPNRPPPPKPAPPRRGPPKKAQGGVGKWRVNQWPVDEVIGKNFLFFEAQESGRLRAGHRIKWRGDSFLNDNINGRNLDGGWFDAGVFGERLGERLLRGPTLQVLACIKHAAYHLKLVYPMCWAVAHLAWSMSEGKGMLKEARFGGQSNWDAAVRSLDHGLNFLFRCRLGPGQFVMQVGEKEHDHGNCHRAEQDKFTPRTPFASDTGRGAADLLFQASAAFAAAAVALRGEKDEGSKQNQRRAENFAKLLYSEAKAQAPSIYSNTEPECFKTYPSGNWEHAAFWAAAWMFKLTGNQSYAKEAKNFQFGADSNALWFSHNWDNVYFGACLLMWEQQGRFRGNPSDRHDYETNLRSLADAHLQVKGGVRRTPKNLTFVDQWGTLRHACGVAWVLAGYARGLRRQGRGSGADKKLADELMWFSERQVTYAMGAAGRSFIVGFGKNPPRQPHHRNSALLQRDSNIWSAFTNTSKPNAHEITGAMVGGPDLKDKYSDNRNNFQQNEVTLDYNAALLAALVQTSMAYR